MSSRIPLLVLVLVLVLEPAGRAEFPTPFNTEKTPGDPMPAEEAARSMVLPPGFKCQVFATEPDVQQPIAMAWDARGRLWVAECYTYAENPARWNLSLRDRIVIFEDTDSDGHFDKRTVFTDNLQRLTSIELGHGGVYALCAPNLLFIPDKNGDDVPDGEPQVLLDGFNFQTIGHNVVNGLRWGPDGWLYGRHGIVDTSAIGAPGTPEKERVRLNCGIFRYHPVRGTFEVVLNGGTNSWGMDWTESGEMFWINTVIGHLFHGIPGAYYDRMFGSHLNPHVYETIGQTADHYHFDKGNEIWSDIRKGVSSKTSELGGGHAHVGLMIYNGGTWPAEYQGRIFTCNLHGNRINMDVLAREGCGFVAHHGADFMQSKDTWFRGLDLSSGPDGNVFVIDWSDAGECHDSDGVHRTSGRIYKISYGEPKKLAPFDLAKQTDVELLTLLASENNWWARMAARVLEDRGLPRAEFEHKITTADSSDSLYRLHLASALQRLPLEARFPVAGGLAAHAEDANDRQQPLMIWYGIEPAVVPYPDQAIALALSSKIPTVTRLVTRRLVEEIEQTPGPVEQLLAAALKDQHAPAREAILRGLSAGLKGFGQVAKPRAWDEFARLMSPSQGELVRDVSLVFGSGRAVDELVALVKSADGDPNARSSAFASLLRSPKPELFALARGLINDKVLGAAARLGLAKFGEADVPKVLLAGWPDRSLEWRAANVTTLSSRPAWAKELLAAVEQNKLARAEITPFQARQIRSLGDASLNEQLSKVWGELRDTPEARQQEMARWKALLTPDVLAKADASKGRLVFSTVCAACHKLYGEGAAIGPDLTGSDRHNLDYLLGNIVDPNAVVPADYRVSVLKLKDGRVLAGVIPEQTDKLITVQTPAERVTVPRSDIVEFQQMPQSLMPEGILEALGPEKVPDLFAYLMGNGQVPLPK
ncbi:MAG TPA: PVC-type heme-binding CxxCH protein [Chthoniobacteraceae bacterium]|jgi:putative membrane-bound dehydrogenase-like protein|nr:PVC-type heme-binding CxxCH protein [Chthoniobacteraceae bacterium]